MVNESVNTRNELETIERHSDDGNDDDNGCSFGDNVALVKTSDFHLVIHYCTRILHQQCNRCERAHWKRAHRRMKIGRYILDYGRCRVHVIYYVPFSRYKFKRDGKNEWD